MTFVQRFGDALNVNVHFHSLVLDGVFIPEDGEQPTGSRSRFRPLPPPDDREVGLVAARIARRLAVLLRKRGLTADGDPTEVDPLFMDQPFLAALAGASVRGRIATGRPQPVLWNRAPLARRQSTICGRIIAEFPGNGEHCGRPKLNAG